MNTPLTFADALREEVATLQAQFPDLAEALGRAETLVTTGAVFVDEDGRTAWVRSRTDATTFYPVNGHCPCKADAYRSEPCAHRLALRVYHKVADRLTQDEERWTVDLEDPAAPAISPEFVVHIQGKRALHTQHDTK